MLTGGHFPYEVAGTMRDVLNNIITVAPTPPSQMIEAGLARKMRGRRGRFRRRKAVNEVIEAIVLKSLAKGPEQRYQSAGDFARDIGVFRKPSIKGLHEPAVRNSHRQTLFFKESGRFHGG
jgi:hypothetical protein